MNEMTKEGWMAFSAIAALLVIVIIGFVVYYMKNPDTWPLTMFNDEPVKTQKITLDEYNRDRFIDKATGVIKDKDVEKVVETEYSAPSTGVEEVSYAYKAEEVKIALIIEENQYDVKNIIEGKCGNVYMVTAYVPGPNVLTNSYKALFGDKVYGDFLPGNIIPSYHPNLSFEEVRIENGVAKIYLDGSFSGSREGVCDAELALAQLEETAKSYPSVNSVEIYQDGQKVN